MKLNISKLVVCLSLLTSELCAQTSFIVTLEPKAKAILSAEIISPVRKIKKRLGDSFKQGDVLIELDKIKATAVYDKALANVWKMTTEWEARQQLYADGSISLFEYKDAEAAYISALSDLTLAQLNIDATDIKAPFDGKVASLLIEEGELPKEGRELIEIVGGRVLLAKLLYPANLLSEMKLGIPLRIEIPEASQTIISSITRIAPVIDPASATVRIEAEIDNSNAQLLPGMTGMAYFDTIKKVEEIPPSSTDEESETIPQELE